MQKNFIVDPEKKEIKLNSKTKAKTFTVQEFYSYLMDLFDEPEYMRYDVPIEAKSKSEFKIINSWKVDSTILKHLKGGTLKI
jgi:hypothetical protein